MNRHYEELVADYAVLDEADYLTAANITVRASNLKATYDHAIAELEKAMGDAEVFFEALEKQKSITLNPNNVSDGERKARADEEVVNAKYLYNQARHRWQDLVATANHLNNIYYTAKMFYETGTRGMREGR